VPSDAAEGSGYWEQIDIIRPLFSDAQPFTQGSILLRLTILDSLYSTNGRYAQFDLETIAREFYAFTSDRKLADYFHGIVSGSTNPKTFFTKKYGLNKNLTEGPSFMSLVSYWLLLRPVLVTAATYIGHCDDLYRLTHRPI
jgi:hypothetical protein